MKVIIIKTGALGDIISASSFFRTVKMNFPEDDIYLLTQDIYKEVVEASPIFTQIFLLPKRRRFFSFLRIFTKLRRLKPDIVLDIQGNLKTNFYCFLTGAKKRYGYYRRRLGRIFLTKGVKRKTKKEQAKNSYKDKKPSQSVLELLGIKNYVKQPELWISEEKRKNFCNLIKRYNLDESKKWIVVHPLSTKGYIAKRWLKERFAELADRLIGDGYEVIFIGVGEYEYVKEIMSKMRYIPKNLVDKTDFHNLCLVIERASLVITTDSSPLHISTAVRTKTIGIFGSTDPFMICPEGAEYIYKKVECNPCYKRVCDDMRCMKAITVEDIYNKAKEILSDENKHSLFN
ncbi:MAG: glycosyltransferase family 9 protein [bacterium]|nr:glycosyltransferase family 9 protein [bacterium]